MTSLSNSYSQLTVKSLEEVATRTKFSGDFNQSSSSI